MPKTKEKRKISQGDLNVFRRGQAKEGGELARKAISLHVKKGVLGEGIKKHVPQRVKNLKSQGGFNPVESAKKGMVGQAIEKRKKKLGSI